MLKYRFSSRTQFRIKMSLLVALLLPLLLKLGFWQLSRYHEKLELEDSLAERLTMAVLELSDINRFDDPIFLPVNVTGRFVSEYPFLLDNQIHQRQAGYDVLMPFITRNGDWVLVNRGWVVSSGRDVLPEIKTPEQEVTIKGTIYRPLGKPFLLENNQWAQGWPKRIQAIDFNRFSEALGQTLPSYTVQLNVGQPGALQVRPKEMKTSASKHQGYAVQWFLMAFVLLGLYLWQMNRRSFHENKIANTTLTPKKERQP